VNYIDRGTPGKRSHVKMPQSRRQMIVALFMVGAVVASSLQLLYLMSQKGADDDLPARISMTPHSPIFIASLSDFSFDNGVRSGSGTSANPFIISDWSIDATDSPGIFVVGTSYHFVIRNVTINSTGQANDGIIFQGVSNAWMHNVTIVDCQTGIDIEGVCSSIRIDASSISNSMDHGIVTQFGATSSVDISSNTIFANGGTGIALGSASQFNIASNTISTNDTSSSGRRGITLLQSSNGIVTGNYVTAGYDEAMSCTLSQNVVVAGNRFSSVWYYDLRLMSCTGFQVYGNNFVGSHTDVPEHAYDNGGTSNVWNASYPVGGNYWLDYTGVDEKRGPNQDQGGKDGIGDQPYLFNVSQTDYYPLNTSGPVEPIPEFPSLLLPIISVLALLVAVVRRSTGKEF
jgi:parallel beta-helix repeat protein